MKNLSWSNLLNDFSFYYKPSIVDKAIRKLTDFDISAEKRHFWLFLLNFSKNSKKIQNFISCVFLYLLKGPIKKFSALKLKRCDLSFFLKPKMSKFDLFLDPWPLTFWPMTLTFYMLQDITKTHILCKFHKDPPMGTWWKVVDSPTTDYGLWTMDYWLLTMDQHNHFIGWAMPPKNHLHIVWIL